MRSGGVEENVATRRGRVTVGCWAKGADWPVKERRRDAAGLESGPGGGGIVVLGARPAARRASIREDALPEDGGGGIGSDGGNVGVAGFPVAASSASRAPGAKGVAV